MAYIYNDDDNASMNDEAYEMEKLEAKLQKRKDAVEGLLDMLGLSGGCRECPNILELAEGFLDKNGLIANEQYDYLVHVCKVCGGQGTGVTPKKNQGWLDNEWSDRLEWAHFNLPKYSCAWCPTAFRIYGEYKDPDDEWKAIEKECCRCKYFEEAE